MSQGHRRVRERVVAFDVEGWQVRAGAAGTTLRSEASDGHSDAENPLAASVSVWFSVVGMLYNPHSLIPARLNNVSQVSI